MTMTAATVPSLEGVLWRPSAALRVARRPTQKRSLAATVLAAICAFTLIVVAAGTAPAATTSFSESGVAAQTHPATAVVATETPPSPMFVGVQASAGYDGSLGCCVAPRQLAAFSRSSIDDAVTSVSRGHNDQISVGARAIDKRLGANSAPFQGIEATTANAQALVTDILESPARTVFGQRTYDVYNAAGQGARFDVSSNRFITFLDETIATR